MSHLIWRDADLRRAPDKKELQRFRCTDEDLTHQASATGRTTTHSRIYEWRVQQLIQEEVRTLNRRPWIVRLGFDDAGLGGVIAAQELEPGRTYDVTLGAIASRLRGRFRGELGDEMLEDIFAAIGERCVEGGHSGEAKLLGIIHRDNFASKRMCARNGFVCDGTVSGNDDYEDWSRWLPIPDPILFEPTP